MKRLLSILILACTLSACENDGAVSAPTPQGSEPITFGLVETRADITTGDIEDNGFGVYAFVNKGVEGSAESLIYETLLGNNTSAERVYKDDEGEWTYSEKKFWVANRIYHFYGVYPYNTQYTITEDISNNPTGISYTFTTPDTADEDFVAACTTIDSSQDTPSRVDMDFKHMLSNVSFKVHYDIFGNQGDKFTLNEFTISNIKKVGTLQFAYNMDGSWSVNPLQNMTFTWKPEQGVELENELSLWEDGLMLIPQTIAPGVVNIRVKYTYEDYAVTPDGEKIDTDSVEKVVDTFLPATTWEPGKSYTYKMILHEDDFISFKQIVVDLWGNPQQGGAIIIK